MPVQLSVWTGCETVLHDDDPLGFGQTFGTIFGETPVGKPARADIHEIHVHMGAIGKIKKWIFQP